MLASWSGGNAAVEGSSQCDSAGKEIAWGPEQPRVGRTGNRQWVQAGTRGKELTPTPAASGCLPQLLFLFWMLGLMSPE